MSAKQETMHARLLVRLAKAKERGRGLALSQDEASALLVEYSDVHRERRQLAMLAADAPQFSNPLAVYEAQSVRDRVLAESRR